MAATIAIWDVFSERPKVMGAKHVSDPEFYQ